MLEHYIDFSGKDVSLKATCDLKWGSRKFSASESGKVDIKLLFWTVLGDISRVILCCNAYISW